MNRDELQARIRQRRSGEDEPYRRGVGSGVAGGYQRYEPEPEDAVRHQPSAETPGREWDTRPRDERSPYAPPPAFVPPGDAPENGGFGPRDEPLDLPPVRPGAPGAPVTAGMPPPPILPDPEGVRVDHYDDDAYDPDLAYEYDDYEEERRGPAAGILAVLGFVGLGILALAAGAVLAGVFTADNDVARATPTPAGLGETSPSPIATPPPTPVPTATAAASAAPSGSPGGTNGSVSFPDGFTAQAQPCASQPSSADCGSSGAVNDGEVYILVSFTKGNAADVIGARLLAGDGQLIGSGQIDLRQIGCSSACNGWTFFRFIDLAEGSYSVEVTRNAQPASETSFEVE